MWKIALAKQGIRPLVLIGNTGGSVLHTNNEFERKGFKIVAFDNDPQTCGKQFGNNSKMEHSDSIKQAIKDVGAKIAILDVADAEVQAMTSLMVDAGISTILNYSSQTNIRVPNHVNVLDMVQASHQLLVKGNSPDSVHPTMPYSSSLAVLGPLFSNPTPLLIPHVRYKFGIYPPEQTIEDVKVVQQSKKTELSLSEYFSSSKSVSRYNMDFVELELLGKGGYGSVYRAYNRIDDCDYALKKIYMTPNDSKHLQEVRAMAKFSHSNIVRYFSSWIELVDSAPQIDTTIPSVLSSSSPYNNPYNNPVNDEISSHEDFSDSFLAESGTCSSRSQISTNSSLGDVTQTCRNRPTTAILYIQMELCSRTTLRDWMSQADRNVDLPQCLLIVSQLLEGLRYIHNLGFVHRDVTPSNLFIDCYADTVSLKIGDMGLTKRCTGPIMKTDSYSDLTHPSSEGIFEEQTLGVGTYLYASPEQLTTNSYTTSADIYSVGVILFELLQPFKTQMERVLTLTKLKAGLIATTFSILYPRECGFIQWLLCSDAAQRPTAQQMLYQLSR